MSQSLFVEFFWQLSLSHRRDAERAKSLENIGNNVHFGHQQLGMSIFFQKFEKVQDISPYRIQYTDKESATVFKPIPEKSYNAAKEQKYP